MYYSVFYRSRLVPRWLSGWGVVGATLVTVSGLLVMFHLAAPLGTTQSVLALPIAVQEMVLAVWLIGDGLKPLAIGVATMTDVIKERAAGGVGGAVLQPPA